MHIEAIPQQMRLVSHALLQTLELGLLEVVLQDGAVLRVRAFIDDDPRALAGAQSPHVGETDLGDYHVKVVLSLVDVCAHWNDAADADGVRLRWPRRGRVHDAVLGGAQEVGRSAEAVEHTAAHDARAVGMRVDVDLDGGVHPDDAKAADDLGRVRHLLRTQEKLVVVGLPVIVEALEALGRESDGGGRGEVQASRVEEVEESVLYHFGPDLQIVKVRVTQSTNDGVGNVSNAGLERQKGLGHPAVLNFVFEELD